MDFPWRIYKKDEILLEFKRLKTHIRKEIVFPIPFSTIGFKCTNFYFQYERMKTPRCDRQLSTINFWLNNKSKVMKIIKSDKYKNRDLFSTLNFLNHTPSHFPIVTAGKIYKYFNAKKIFDPYAGWGDRCLAAMALDIDYTGIDSNTNLRNCYQEMIKNYETESNIQIIFNKSENCSIESVDFDFVFSSPPFWKNGKMLERYNNIEISYDYFMLTSLIPVLLKCFRRRKIWICLYITEEMYNDLVKIFGKCKKSIKFNTNNNRFGNIYCWKSK